MHINGRLPIEPCIALFDRIVFYSHLSLKYAMPVKLVQDKKVRNKALEKLERNTSYRKPTILNS